MSEENTDIPTVAEVEYVKDTKGQIGVIGSIIPKISYEELVEKDELIRLSDHEQAMEEQREEVLELIEEEIENWKSNLQYDDDRRFNEGCVVALQDLKQKLKSDEQGEN